MLSLSEARALIAQKIHPLPGRPVPLADAAGRILRQNVRAPEDLPAFHRSAMDGYAIAAGDPAEKFRIVAEIQPGAPARRKIAPGQCARIFTGAPIPPGASQVLMQENVRLESDFMIPLFHDAAPHIRRRGEDARKGDLLLSDGSRLAAGDLALLAGLGVARPKVSPLVRVAHLTTGSELVSPSQKPRPGQIRDSNSTLVAAFVQRFGGVINHHERLPDNFSLLLKKARPLQKSCDLLLLSGGASAGDHDFGKKLLAALGFQLHFTAINLRPGKPLVFATRGRQAAFVIPGNPVSHLVTLHAAVRVALDQFTGASLSWPLLPVPLAEPLDAPPPGRDSLLPARLEISRDAPTGLVVRPLRWQSSGDVTGLAGVNALLQLNADARLPQVGDPVSVLLLEVP